MIASAPNGYSSRVEIELEIGDRRLEVAQVGNAMLILRHDCDFGDRKVGKLLLSVDGERLVYPVTIEGVEKRRVLFTHLPPETPPQS